MSQFIEVPQTPYTPPTQFVPEPSVFFSSQGIQGVNLRDAYDGNLSSLDYRDYPHHITPQRITLLIQWPGYGEWVFRNITIMSLGNPSVKHTMHKLINTLARKIQDFFTEMSSVHGRVPGWELQNIDFNALYITELRHVSQGRWMPVLYYEVPQQITYPVGGAAVHYYNV